MISHRTARRLAWTALALSGVAGALVAGAQAWVHHRGGPIYESVDGLPERIAANAWVAIVPGARVHKDGSPYQALEDRLLAANELFHAGRVSRILVSGDHATDGYDEVHGMRAWLLAQGVPSDAIYLDHAGLRTLDTMVRASEVFGVQRAVVCTQRFHLPRSLYLARAAGIDAVGLVADRHVYAKATADAIREAGARVKAVLDVHILGTRPRHLGPRIPIDGPASATHDRTTQCPDASPSDAAGDARD